MRRNCVRPLTFLPCRRVACCTPAPHRPQFEHRSGAAIGLHSRCGWPTPDSAVDHSQRPRSRSCRCWRLRNRLLRPATQWAPARPTPRRRQVPWESLQPGDQVLIHWRSTPYKDKWVICRQGTEALPIVVRGVPGPAGELPIIEGSGATTRLGTRLLGREPRGDQDRRRKYPRLTRCRPTSPSRTWTCARRGRPTRSWTTPAATQTYVNNAAAIWIEKGEHIVIRNTRMHDAGNGLFVSSAEPNISRDILIEGNAIYDNGNVGSLFEHNTYTEALGITYQFNYFGPTQGGRRRQQPEGPLGRPGGAPQLDRGRQPPAGSGGNRQPHHPEQRRLPHHLRLRQRAGRDRRVRQPPDRPLRRRQRHHLQVPQGHAALLQQHDGVVSHRPHHAVPPLDQRRARRRAQQHLLRHGRRHHAVAAWTPPAC